jgi:hypothetical protein
MAFRCECGTELDLEAALDALPRAGVGSSGGTSVRCTSCGGSIELRLHDGGYTVGYSYAGGSLHFEPVERVAVAGMNVAAAEPDGLDVRIGQRQWSFAVDRPSRLRFAVLPRASCIGKRLREVDFARLGVEVEHVERGRERLAPDPELVLSLDDFLHVRGPAPALTRAFRMMCEG